MIDLKSVFTSKSQREIEAQLKEADRMIDLTGDIARQCLDYDSFKAYRETYKRTEESIVSTMITYTKNFVESDKGDTTKYALTMVRLLTKLHTLRYLLTSIEADARKGQDGGVQRSNQERETV